MEALSNSARNVLPSSSILGHSLVTMSVSCCGTPLGATTFFLTGAGLLDSGVFAGAAGAFFFLSQATTKTKRARTKGIERFTFMAARSYTR